MQESSFTFGRIMRKVGKEDKEDRRDGSFFGSPHDPLAPGSPLLLGIGPLLDL